MFGSEIIYTTGNIVSSLLFSLFYADDTNMFATGENIKNQICLMKTEFKKK